MKIAYASDIHLEFGDIELKNTANADVLVLAGDIMISQYLHDYPTIEESERCSVKQELVLRFRRFIKNVSENFPHVIVIAGNHEFYNGKWYAGIKYLEDEYHYDNIHFLERGTITIGDVTFIGTTLWTDLNDRDPVTMYCIKYAMNDYKLIRNDRKGYSLLSPEDTVVRFRSSIDYMANAVWKKDNKFVVVTHHAPSFKSVSAKYRGDREMNGGYCSDLSNFIINSPQIKLWFHGHVHEEFDYYVGETRVLCNPRGYHEHQDIAANFKLKYVEV